MRVIQDKFLEANGCGVTHNLTQPQPCPCCHTLKLHVSVDRFSNATMFRCPNCGFQGDAIQFTAWAQKESIADAVKRFEPGGNLCPTLVTGYTSDQLKEYTKQHISQDNIQRYVRDMHAAVASPTGKNTACRVSLFNRGRVELPPAMGLVQTDPVPPEFSKLESAQYKREPHFSFTYRYNGNVVGINTRPVSNIDVSDYHTIWHENLGVFMEDTVLPDAKDVFIAPDDLSAAALYHQAQNNCLTPLQVISVRDLPLPNSLAGVNNFYLLGFRDRPLVLRNALRYLCNDIVEFGTKPQIYVLSIGIPLHHITAEHIADWTRKHQRLHTWIAHELIEVYRQLGESEVLGILQPFKMTSENEDLLVRALQTAHAPEELEQAIRNLRTDLTDERRLSNGKRITRTINGFIGYEGAVPVSLSNTMFKVDRCVLTRNGDVTYDVTLFCNKAQTNPLRANMQQDDFRSDKDLRKAVQSAYIRHGENPPIAFYQVPGYNWWEIRDAFGDAPLVTKEVPCLGVDSALQLHLPNRRIDLPKGRIYEQGPILTYPAEVTQCYNALGVDFQDALPTLTKLWASPEPEHAAYAAGIAHIMGQILMGYAAAKTGTVYRPHHLVYVDISPHTWLPCLQQLSATLRGCDYLPRIPTGRMTEHLRTMGDLGCLPYVCAVPTIAPVRARTMIQDSPVSLLALAENVMGEQISGEPNVWFIAMEKMNPRLPGPIDAEIVAGIQQELPTAIAYCMYNWQSRVRPGWFAEVHPIVQVHEWVRDQLGAPITGAVANLCKKYYTAYSYCDPRAFLYELKRMFYTGGSPYTPQTKLSGKQRPKDDPYAVFEDLKEDKVYVHHHLVDVINQQNKQAKFQVETLTEQLSRAGYLYGEVDEPYFVLKGEVWATHVANVFKTLKTQPFRLVVNE